MKTMFVVFLSQIIILKFEAKIKCENKFLKCIKEIKKKYLKKQQQKIRETRVLGGNFCSVT